MWQLACVGRSLTGAERGATGGEQVAELSARGVEAIVCIVEVCTDIRIRLRSAGQSVRAVPVARLTARTSDHPTGTAG